MVNLKVKHTAKHRLSGHKEKAVVGVVASGNLEVLLERTLKGSECEVEINTPVKGFDELGKAVITDFVERASPGGLKTTAALGRTRFTCA
jgi:malonate decarboxylase delta subunit